LIPKWLKVHARSSESGYESHDSDSVAFWLASGFFHTQRQQQEQHWQWQRQQWQHAAAAAAAAADISLFTILYIHNSYITDSTFIRANKVA